MKLEKKPRLTAARDLRSINYKYYPIKDDKTHRFAVQGGRCYNCGRITDSYCDKCSKWICENHLVKGREEGECFCLDCKDSSLV